MREKRGKKKISKSKKKTRQGKNRKNKLTKNFLSELKKFEKKVLRKGQFIEGNLKVGTKIINYIFKNGKGMPIILLHGAGGNAQIYSFLLPYYKMKNPLYLLTMPGFGKSSNIRKTFTLEHYSKMINKFLEKKKIKKVILVGHSIGGSLAIVFAKLFPKKVFKLIIISPAGLHPDKSLTLKRVVGFIKGGLKTKKKRKKFISKKSIIITLIDALNPFTWTELDYFSRFKINKYLPIKKIKTLILWPSRDHCPETPPKVAKIFNKQIKNSKLIYVQGDHSFPLVFPRMFWKKIEEFLKLE